MSEDELEDMVQEGKREAEAAFGNGEGYLSFSRSHAALFQFMFQPLPESHAQINQPILSELERHSTFA